MNRGENMKRVLKMLIFTVLVIAATTAAVYADRFDTGWKGYGLYNLNESQVTISSESDNVLINGGDVSAVYEYTITNKADRNITVNFGYPDNGIKKFSVHDGSKYLSYKSRNTSYLKTNYGVKNLQTPDGRWYLFNMAFTPGQTRIIKVTIDAEVEREENDTYNLSFFKDRDYSYAIKSEKHSFTLKLEGFKPYGIYELDGLKPEDISEEGIVSISFSGNYGNGMAIVYQPVDRMAVQKLGASTYKKPKQIAEAFDKERYGEAEKLCGEYIDNPSDSKLSLEQVKYIKAEAIRLQGKNEDYLSAVEQLDISKLYPGRIRYKILLDRLDANRTLGNEDGVNAILEELIPEIRQSSPYLLYWLEKNDYKLSEDDSDVSAVITPESPSASKHGKGFDILGALIAVINGVRESKWAYTALGLIAGFILGRLSKRGKKRRSVYLFRD